MQDALLGFCGSLVVLFILDVYVGAETQEII
jgi:hypothetical protein